MKLGVPVDVKVTLRHFDFSRQFAVRDIYDALVELITNSDDSYHRLYKKQLRNDDGGLECTPIIGQIRLGEPGGVSHYSPD
jgi:hypothetical protein